MSETIQILEKPNAEINFWELKNIENALQQILLNALFIALFASLFCACGNKQNDNDLGIKNDALIFLLSPYSKILNINEKLSFTNDYVIPKDLQERLLSDIANKNTKELWQKALSMSLSKEYSLLQNAELEAQTLQEGNKYQAQRLQSVRDRSLAYSMYVLKNYVIFFDSQQDNDNFCQKFLQFFSDKNLLYAMGNMGFEGAMFEPFNNQYLIDWIAKDRELFALYGLINSHQKRIIEAYSQRKCK